MEGAPRVIPEPTLRILAVEKAIDRGATIVAIRGKSLWQREVPRLNNYEHLATRHLTA